MRIHRYETAEDRRWYLDSTWHTDSTDHRWRKRFGPTAKHIMDVDTDKASYGNSAILYFPVCHWLIGIDKTTWRWEPEGKPKAVATDYSHWQLRCAELREVPHPSAPCQPESLRYTYRYCYLDWAVRELEQEWLGTNTQWWQRYKDNCRNCYTSSTGVVCRKQGCRMCPAAQVGRKKKEDLWMRKRQKCYALRTFPNFFTYTSVEAFSNFVRFHYTLWTELLPRSTC